MLRAFGKKIFNLFIPVYLSIARNAISPKTKVIAVNAALRPATYLKYKQTRKEPYDESVIEYSKSNLKPLADGIAVINPGVVTFPYVVKYCDDFVVVTEDEIAKAIALLGERNKIISEGAGASTVAAVLFKKFKYEPGAKIVCAVSGGNIELTRFAECVETSKQYLKETD